MIHDVRAAISIVAEALGPLKNECVLTGGAMVSFYLTDSQELFIRATDDVDVIINVIARGDYQDRVDPTLRKLGFKQSLQNEDPICRWYIQEITVDVMPIDESVLGFSNPWYRPGFQSAIAVNISEDMQWRMLSPAYFLATKLTAFLDRGQEDPMSSRDFEDIITLVNGRPELIEEIKQADAELQKFIVGSIRSILENSEWRESIQFHLASDAESQARIDVILDRLEAIGAIDAL